MQAKASPSRRVRDGRYPGVYFRETPRGPVARLERGERPSVEKREIRVLSCEELSWLIEGAPAGYRAFVATLAFDGVAAVGGVGSRLGRGGLRGRGYPGPVPGGRVRPSCRSEDGASAQGRAAHARSGASPPWTPARVAVLGGGRLRVRGRHRHGHGGGERPAARVRGGAGAGGDRPGRDDAYAPARVRLAADR